MRITVDAPTARRVRWLVAILGVVAALPGAPPLAAQVPACQFVLGFAALAALLPDEVGECVDEQATQPNGDVIQHTTRGLLVWRKTDNWTAFTDGYQTWVNGPYGLQRRLNTERFPWERLSVPEMKLRLVDAFGSLLYCDPDFYPVARADELAQARARWPQIQADQDTYAAILAHEHLVDGSLSGPQILQVYRLYKQLAALRLRPQPDGSYAFSALFGADDQGTQVQGSIDAQGTIQVSSRQPARLNCPVCLPGGTPIDTPQGPVPVEALRPGTPVWTADSQGRRRPGIVVEVGSTPVSPGHQMVRLALSDGRSIAASPGHPLADGRPLGSLRPGDEVDGATVVEVSRETYDGGRAYDLLPSGPQGVYWGGAVPLRSTLAGGARRPAAGR